MLAAVAVVLVLLGDLLPLAGLVISLFWPVPIVLIYLRHGLRASLLTVAVTVVVLAAFAGPLAAALRGLTLGGLGVAFGWAIARRLPASQALLAGAVAGVGVLGVSFLSAGLLLDVNVVEELSKAASQAMKMASGVADKVGAGKGPADPGRLTDQMEKAVRLLFPAVLFASAVLLSFLNYLAVGLVLRRMGHKVEAFPPFAQWRFPVYLVYVYGAAVVLALLTQPGASLAGMPGLGPLAKNIYLFLSWVFLIQGAAIIYFLLRRWRLAAPAAGVLTGLFTLGLGPLVIWGGLVEGVLRYREMVAAREKGEAGA